MNFFQAKQAFDAIGDNHPGKMVIKMFQVDAPNFVPDAIVGNREQLIQETIQLSKRAFHSNETHPGNLYVRYMIIRSIDDLEEQERQLRTLVELAAPVYEGQPRGGAFDMRLSEVLGLRAEKESDPAAKLSLIEEAESIL